MFLYITMQRIFKLALDVFQPVRELQHVLFFVLFEYFKLNVKGFIPDGPQLLWIDECIYIKKKKIKHNNSNRMTRSLCDTGTKIKPSCSVKTKGLFFNPVPITHHDEQVIVVTVFSPLRSFLGIFSNIVYER